MNQLAAASMASAALLAGAAQPAMANCDPQARQQFVDSQLQRGTDFSSFVLEPANPETTTIIVTEAGWAGNVITNPLVKVCDKRIVAYIGRRTADSTELVPAAKAGVSEFVRGNDIVSVKNPRKAGLLVRRSLHAQSDKVYGPLGFSDGKLTFGLMPQLII